MLKNNVDEIRKKLREIDAKSKEDEIERYRAREKEKREQRKSSKNQILDFLLTEFKSLTFKKNIRIEKIEIWSFDKSVPLKEEPHLHERMFTTMKVTYDDNVSVRFKDSKEVVKEIRFDYPFFGCKTFSDLVDTLRTEELFDYGDCGFGTKYTFCMLDGFFDVCAIKRFDCSYNTITINIHP